MKLDCSNRSHGSALSHTAAALLCAASLLRCFSSHAAQSRAEWSTLCPIILNVFCGARRMPNATINISPHEHNAQAALAAGECRGIAVATGRIAMKLAVICLDMFLRITSASERRKGKSCHCCVQRISNKRDTTVARYAFSLASNQSTCIIVNFCAERRCVPPVLSEFRYRFELFSFFT